MYLLLASRVSYVNALPPDGKNGVGEQLLDSSSSLTFRFREPPRRSSNNNDPLVHFCDVFKNTHTVTHSQDSFLVSHHLPVSLCLDNKTHPSLLTLDYL